MRRTIEHETDSYRKKTKMYESKMYEFYSDNVKMKVPNVKLEN